MGSSFSSYSDFKRVHKRKRIPDSSNESKRPKNDTSQQRLIHDVFISFRGGDTRKKFTSHLLGALRRHCFDVFHDTMLPRGHDVHSELMKAITESRISAVVFSVNYVDSDWCLDELVKIMDCQELNQQIVLPIFLDVEPSHVREQKGSYKKAFSDHEAKFDRERVKKWRQALREAGNLSGLHLQNDANGDEEKFIEAIMKQVGKLLNRPVLHVADHPIGIESRVQELVPYLSLDSNDVSIVGICGTGGTGKTTLAKAVYGRIAPDFESHSFLADVRDVFGQPNGKVTLQNQLISNLVQNDKSQIAIVNYHQGIEKIKQMIGCRKVLLVLDDVDNVEQLQILAIDRKSFHPGSRIIITTRDKASINMPEGINTYEPRLLNQRESLELFSWHCFGKDHRTEGFEKLSEEVVSCAAGLPLVLVVWGAHFRSFTTVELWRSALDKLIKIPHKDVQAKLKISYDSLGDRGQKLFLDIACFFIGMDRDLVVKVSHDESLGAFPDSEIELLVGRCLVCISGNEVSMHDVIRDMGREIIRLESVDEPGQRSRLWDRKHVIDVLKECSGTEAVGSIILRYSKGNEEVIADAKAFEKMKNLRLICFDNLPLPDYSNDDMPAISFRKLKYLRWYGFPSSHIPNMLDMRNVVAIDLQYSKLKTLEGIKNLKKLQLLNVSNSSFLSKTPDFTEFKDLEEIFFRGCTNLEELHSSVGCLNKLVVLDLCGCTRLRIFPSKSIRKLRSLKRLDLTNCCNVEWDLHIKHLVSSLKECCVNQLVLAGCRISRVPGEVLTLVTLTELNLSENGFHNLPRSLVNLHHLDSLELSGCYKLQSIPDLPKSLRSIDATNCRSLTGLPLNMTELKSLRKVRLVGCYNLRSIPDLPKGLFSIYATNCYNLRSIPDLPKGLSIISADNCRSLTDLPSNLTELKSLAIVHLNGCYKLGSADPLCLMKFQGLSNLQYLDMGYCNVSLVPSEIGSLVSLKFLCLHRNIFSSLPDIFGSLHHLGSLYLSNCYNLRSIPDLPKGLYRIDAINCRSLTDLPSNMTQLKSLSEVNLNGCSKLGSTDPLCLMKFQGLRNLFNLNMSYCNVSLVPNEIGSLVSLERLYLCGNIFSSLPDSVGRLQKLYYLGLKDCAQLKSFPSLPSSIVEIEANSCNMDLMSEIFNCPVPVYQERSINYDLVIEVSGTEVPIWFTYQSVENFLSFVAPQQVDRKIRGLILCAIIFNNTFDLFGLSFYVELVNKTQGTSYKSDLSISSNPTSTCAICFIRDSKFVVEGGDNVVVVFHHRIMRKPVPLKKTGACLIYEGDGIDPKFCNQNVIKNTCHDPDEAVEFDEDDGMDPDEDNETIFDAEDERDNYNSYRR